MPNASSAKINASQELTHLVNGGKNEREETPDCQVYSEYPMRNLRYVYAKGIYNPHNLPLLLITQCWGKRQHPWAASRVNTNPLGLGVGSTFWFQNASPTSSSLVPRATLREAGQAPVSSFRSTAQLNASSVQACGP